MQLVLGIVIPFAVVGIWRALRAALTWWDTQGVTEGSRRRNELADIAESLRGVELDRRRRIRETRRRLLDQRHWKRERWGERWDWWPHDEENLATLEVKERQALSDDHMALHWIERDNWSAEHGAWIQREPLVTRRSELRRETPVGTLVGAFAWLGGRSVRSYTGFRAAWSVGRDRSSAGWRWVAGLTLSLPSPPTGESAPRRGKKDATSDP